MRYRYKLLILMLAISITPLAIIRTFGAKTMHQIRDEIVTQSRFHLVQHTTSQLKLLAKGFAKTLSQGRNKLEIALMYQAGEAERCLNLKLLPSDSMVCDRSRLCIIPSEFNPEPSSIHQKIDPNGDIRLIPVSYQNQIITSPPDLPFPLFENEVKKLYHLTPSYIKLHNSLNEKTVYWHQTILENGLHSIFPAYEKLPNGYDAKALIWYKQHQRRSQYLWSPPYIDPISGQNVFTISTPIQSSDESVTGITAITISFHHLFKSDYLLKNVPEQTRFFVTHLVNSPERVASTEPDTARILIISSNHTSHLQTDMKYQWLTSSEKTANQFLIDDYKKGVGNTRRIPFQGEDSLWVYAPLRENSFVFLITPYSEILKPAELTKKRVMEKINDTLLFTGIGLLAITSIVIFLATTFSRTVTRSIRTLSEGATELAEGNFETRVSIKSRDEFQEMGKIFNRMGPRLEENYRIRQSLAVAHEVQNNLLPRSIPTIHGLDIFGTSRYCDETGGDYYDFLEKLPADKHQVGIVVGDVSGHGISSALLMTSARAHLRQRFTFPSSLSQLIKDVNIQLTGDIDQSGSFMSLFFAMIDTQSQTFSWSNAGHDAAFLYTLETKEFTELQQRQLPMGVDQNFDYQSATQPLLPGQILIIGTDGIWETRNAAGKMFGKDTFKSLISENAGKTSEAIVKIVFDSLDTFRNTYPQEDDITLVVVRASEKRNYPKKRTDFG